MICDGKLTYDEHDELLTLLDGAFLDSTCHAFTVIFTE